MAYQGFLQNLFRYIDPVLDVVDPAHDPIQRWSTGEDTREGQARYFQQIAPGIVGAFFPAAGAALAGIDGASTGNYAKAGIGAVGALAGSGALSSASDTGTALQASEGLASTGGTSAEAVNASLGNGISGSLGSASTQAAGFGDDLGQGISAYQSTGVTPGTYVQSPGYAWGAGQDTGLLAANALSSNYVGAGNEFNQAGLLSANETVKNMPWYDKIKAGDVMKAGKQGADFYGKLEAQKAQRAKEMAAQRPGFSPPFEAMPQARQSSFAQLAPYQSFQGGFNQGGFNPQPMNKRFNQGLL